MGYFQKIKREDMPARITYASIYLVAVTAAYVLNFTRLALCLLVLHYVSEAVFHVARLLHFADKDSVSFKVFSVWNLMFIVTRLASIILSILTFWFGLADNEAANFPLRVVSLAFVIALQGYMMQRFITFHLGRHRENAASNAAALAEAKKAKRAAKRDELTKKSSEEDLLNELPEVDQNTKILRSRVVKSSKRFLSPTNTYTHTYTHTLKMQ